MQHGIVRRRREGPRLQVSHVHDHTKLAGNQRHDRQARLTHKLNLSQAWIALDLPKRHWPPQGLDGGKIDRAPIALPGGWVWVGCSRNVGDADHRFFDAAMIEENFVALAHSAQIIAGGVVSNTCPVRLAVRDKIRPRVGAWFRFHQPEIFHARVVNRSGRIRQPRPLVSQSD
jgi:hypothetical protein